MNLNRERKLIDAALDDYRSWLDKIPDAKFTETPPGGGWSYAEVYSHIMKATLGASINLERCTHDNCEPTTKGLTLIGKYILFTGSFPPIKLKTPKAFTDKNPIEKIDKEEARNLLIKCRKRVETTFPLVKDASPHSKNNHPRMGMLNAAQWLRFIRIHLQHHLKQLQRIETIMS